MNKRIIYGLLLILALIIITGCNSKKISSNSNEVMKTMKVIVEDKEYIVDLENNETTKKIIKILPQEFSMTELNNNEKYVYLNESLPTKSYNPKHIDAGDIMLFGNDCLVIFYKSFDTSYSYTKIGHIKDLPDLGNENIIIKFTK